MLGEWTVDCPDALDTPVDYEIEVEITVEHAAPRIGLLAKIETETIREAGTEDNPFDVDGDAVYTDVAFDVSLSVGGGGTPVDPGEGGGGDPEPGDGEGGDPTEPGEPPSGD